MADISKSNSFSEIPVINTWFFIFLRQKLHATCEDPTESMTVIPANIPKTFSPHNAKWLVSQSRLEKVHKRFTCIAAVLDPQVGLTHSTDVVCAILFLRATSFNSFHFLSRFPLKVNNILIDGSWMLAVFIFILFYFICFITKKKKLWKGCHNSGWPFILMKGRDEINNGLAAGATFSFSPRARFPFSLPLSSACHPGYIFIDETWLRNLV